MPENTPPDFMKLSAVLRSRRDRLMQLPPQIRDKVLTLFFNKSVSPRLTAGGISGKDLDTAKTQWIQGILGGPQTPLPTGFGTPETVPPGLGTKLSAAGASAMGTGYGMAANVLRGYRKLPGEGPPSTEVNKFLDQAIKEYEQQYFGLKEASRETSPVASGLGSAATGFALSTPAFMGGLGAVPKAVSKLPLLGSMARAGLGTLTASPLYTSELSSMLEAAKWGALSGPITDRLLGFVGEKKAALLKRLGRKAISGTKLEAKVATATEGLKEGATPEEYQKALQDIYEKQQASLKKTKTPVDLTTKEARTASTKEAVRWRKQQYAQLGRIGLNVKKDSPFYDLVHKEGKSADEVIAQIKLSGELAKAEHPEAQKVVESVVKGTGASKEAAPVVKPSAETKGEAPVQLAGGKGVLDPGAKRKRLMQRYDELVTKQEAAKTPLEKARIQKSINNVKSALAGDKEAERRLSRAEAASLRREKSIITPAPKHGYESSGEEGVAGKAVPIVEPKTPAFEMIDSLKALEIPGVKVMDAYNVLERRRKAGAPEYELRDLVDRTYRLAGKKLGIEGADDMPLEDLYNRVTAVGSKTMKPPTLGVAIDPKMKKASRTFVEGILSDPKIIHYADTVGLPRIGVVKAIKDPGIAGVAFTRQYYDLVREKYGDAAPDILRVYINAFVTDNQNLVRHLVDSFQRRNPLALLSGEKLTTMGEEKSRHAVTHEITHILSERLGLPLGEVTPKALMEDIKRELPSLYDLVPQSWLGSSAEAFTEVLTNYFEQRLPIDGKLHKFAEAIIKSSDDPAIRGLVGTSLVLALIAKGVYPGGDKWEHGSVSY